MLEELKVIMETLGTATGAAKQFGVFWLSIELIKVVLGYALGGAALYSVVRIIHKIISTLKDAADETEFIHSLRRLVDTEAYGHITNDEKNIMTKAIKLGIEKEY